MASGLPERQNLDRDETRTSLTAIFSWNYDSEIDQLRTSLVDMHKFVLEDFRRRARGESAADSLATARERERVLKAMKSLGYINK